MNLEATHDVMSNDNHTHRIYVLQCVAACCSVLRLALMGTAALYSDGYCSTVQGLLDWFEVDLGFTELLFVQINPEARHYVIPDNNRIF